MNTKAHRALGIAWMPVCIFVVALAARPLPHLYLLYDYRPSPEFCLLVLTWALYLAGAVASGFLFRGAAWARRFMSAVAVLSLILCALGLAAGLRHSLIILAVFVGTLSVVTLIVLLFSKAQESEPKWPY